MRYLLSALLNVTNRRFFLPKLPRMALILDIYGGKKLIDREKVVVPQLFTPRELLKRHIDDLLALNRTIYCDLLG